MNHETIMNTMTLIGYISLFGITGGGFMLSRKIFNASLIIFLLTYIPVGFINNGLNPIVIILTLIMLFIFFYFNIVILRDRGSKEELNSTKT